VNFALPPWGFWQEVSRIKPRVVTVVMVHSHFTTTADPIPWYNVRYRCDLPSPRHISWIPAIRGSSPFVGSPLRFGSNRTSMYDHRTRSPVDRGLLRL